MSQITSALVRPTQREQLIRAELLAGAVTLAAALLLVVNVGTGDRTALLNTAGSPEQLLAVAMCLNVALVLYAWRRTRDLQQETSARLQLEEAAARLAMQDHVTGLLCRRNFFDQAAAALLGPAPAAAVILLDLDHFKPVNDFYGHAIGDELLAGVARVIRHEAPRDALCARLGGDEMAIAFTCGGEPEQKAAELAGRIIAALEPPFELGGSSVRITTSIGIATCCPSSSMTVLELLRRSDLAMYESKRLGRNRFTLYDEELQRSAGARSRHEQEIRTGIAAGQFIPFYQPLTDLDSNALVGFEVLARWNHPIRGFVEPGEFLEVAEKTGLVTDLSLCVMRRALLDAAAWDPNLQIAFNLSPIQFKDAMLAERILALLHQTSFPADRLQVEITEESFLHNRAAAIETLSALKAEGVTIALEDFGRGYSSFSKLKGIPFDRIKIDRDFVLTMAENEQSAAIVTAIARLADSLNVPISAEGVEDPAIQAHLQELGCSEGQGWLFGRPMPAAEVRQLFRREA